MHIKHQRYALDDVTRIDHWRAKDDYLLVAGNFFKARVRGMK